MNAAFFKSHLKAGNPGSFTTATETLLLTKEHDRLYISGEFTLDDITFESQDKYENEIIFDGGVYSNISFRGGNFKKLTFRTGTFNGFVSFRGGTFDSILLLGGAFNRFLGTLDGYKNFEVGARLADQLLVIHRFEIEGGVFTNNIWINGGQIDRLEIKSVLPTKIHCKPNDDSIYKPERKKSVPRFESKPKILELILSRYSNRDNFIHISNVDIDRLKFEDFTNIGNITITKINVKDYIRFENSDLGKAAFIDCNFSNIGLIFKSSKVNEIALTGCRLPDPENIVSPGNDEIQKKLALSQIKKVYTNMGDSVEATRYHAQELITYHRTLKGKKHWGEKINLWLNGKTNRHGRSWSRAFWVLLIGSGIFYILYCISLGFWFDFSSKGWRGFFMNLASFPEFFNPIRKSDFLPRVLAKKDETQVLGITYFIDSMAKIFTAYLIYQLIAAFRKHGKKE